MDNSKRDIVVVGAGPAGAYCAFHLAKEGFRPVLLDHSHPREKPCGGGLSPFAQEVFPFLKEIPFAHGEADQIQIVYYKNKRIKVKVKNRYLFVSRLKLDQYILEMALAEGARLEKVKALGAKRHQKEWEIITNKGTLRAGVLIGADGVDSVIRKATVGPFQASDLGMCYGYLAKPLKDRNILLKFLPRRRGYIWIFPRGDRVCIGIATSLRRSADSKTELDKFLKPYYPKLEITSKWAAMIPTLRSRSFRTQVAGPDWMLIGDAAGHVDSVSGEGIPYALRSGELAADAISRNSPVLYDSLWREDYGKFLSRSARMKSLIFNEALCTPYFILAASI